MNHDVHLKSIVSSFLSHHVLHQVVFPMDMIAGNADYSRAQKPLSGRQNGGHSDFFSTVHSKWPANIHIIKRD